MILKDAIEKVLRDAARFLGAEVIADSCFVNPADALGFSSEIKKRLYVA